MSRNRITKRSPADVIQFKRYEKIDIKQEGFDAKAGGVASPILQNGRIYSLPIPQIIRLQKNIEI